MSEHQIILEEKNILEENKKSGFKMPNSFTILFIITIIIAILTWIIPAGQYEVIDGNVVPGTYSQVSQNPQGMWDILTAPFVGMIGNDVTQGAIEISLFILVVGGFLAVVTETGAIDAGIASIIRTNRENMGRLIWVLMFIFALGGSTYGMAEETMPFYALLIPLMVTVGYDSLVAVAVVLVGSGLGVLSSTLNPFATGIASSMAGISMADGIVVRLVFFIITYILGAWYVSRYAKRVKEDDKQSLLADHLEEQREKYIVADNTASVTSKQRLVLILFMLTFVIMILGLIPWSELNQNLTLFDSMHEFLMGTPFLGNFIGQSAVPLGSWYLMEITMLFFFMSIVIGIVYGINEGRFIDVFINGCKDLLSVALICAVARGIQVIMNDGEITATVLHWGEVGLGGLSKGLFIILTYLFYIPMSFLIPSTSGLAAATMGIMAPLGDFAEVSSSLIITAYQAAAGIINLITPTSGVVMGALAMGGIDLSTWWKFMSKLIIMVFVISAIILVLFAII